MATDTKERILEKSLEMFAEYGYNGTNLRDLALSLGISKSALYKHFESKEDIWNSLMNKMETYYQEHFGSLSNMPPIPATRAEFEDMALRMVDFTIHDTNIIRTRKLLITEQFRREQAARLATKHFLTGNVELFTAIFSGMMNNGIMKHDDPEMLAFAFITPVSVLIQYCDRDPGKIEEIISMIRSFVSRFADAHIQ